MIELVQNRHGNFEQLVDKLSIADFTLDKELMNKDLQRFQEELQNTSNKYNKKNLEAIVKYLKKLIKFTKDGKFELCWKIDKDDIIPSTYPIRLIYEELYNINICNYIELDTGHRFVDVDMQELADIMAFEFMYRDLGETNRSVEKLLEHCGVSTYEDSSKLTKYFDNREEYNNIFGLSKILKVEDSPYRIRDTKEMIDYFDSRRFDATTYKEVVQHSCEYANTLVVNSLVKEAAKAGVEFKLLSIDATRIQFIVSECANEFIRDILVGEVSIRSFGRKFKVQPKIGIY